ncbi:hypothetical protein CIPAW_01G029300 [Carya illinoinensis]|uniref:Uncharacterized protein n=1 Tax=Carya illinoinensis TaxID=32201 RepID=A0A8T1RID9_CARIL|nr:hypothetical protein CIPAW_01G029300 [Carya illinoinensis]
MHSVTFNRWIASNVGSTPGVGVGTGKHLTTLYASIDEGKHCMCRSWPGVVIPSKDANTKLPLQGSSCSSTKEK